MRIYFRPRPNSLSRTVGTERSSHWQANEGPGWFLYSMQGRSVANEGPGWFLYLMQTRSVANERRARLLCSMQTWCVTNVNIITV